MTEGVVANPAGTATCPFAFATEAPRVVFDTNVLVSLYVFDDSRYAPLRTALESGCVKAITRDDCLHEFERVLDYPQFKFPRERQVQALTDYVRHAENAAVAASEVPLPRCKDPDDQKFLQLARDAGADWLVTGDKALLTLARRRKLAHLFRIVTPDVALDLVQALTQESRSAIAA